MSTAKAGIKFGTPPQGRERAPYDWSKIAKKCKANPGEWLLIFTEDKTSYVTAIRINGIKALRPGDGFEVRTRNNKRGTPRTCELWLRYNPEKDRSKT